MRENGKQYRVIANSNENLKNVSNEDFIIQQEALV
jgi:hypothetical protein